MRTKAKYQPESPLSRSTFTITIPTKLLNSFDARRENDPTAPTRAQLATRLIAEFVSPYQEEFKDESEPE